MMGTYNVTGGQIGAVGDNAKVENQQDPMMQYRWVQAKDLTVEHQVYLNMGEVDDSGDMRGPYALCAVGRAGSFLLLAFANDRHVVSSRIVPPEHWFLVREGVM